MNTIEKLRNLPTSSELHDSARAVFNILTKTLFQDSSHADILKALDELNPPTVSQTGLEFSDQQWELEYAPMIADGLGKRMVYHSTNQGLHYISMSLSGSNSTIAYLSTQDNLPEPFNFIVENKHHLRESDLQKIHPPTPAIPLIAATEGMHAMHSINTAIVDHTA